MRSFSPDLLLPIYGLGIIGAFLQVAGAQWDVSWHILGIVETFLQPAHFVLYTGIGSVAVATLFGIRYALNYENLKFSQIFSYVFGKTGSNQPYSKLLTGVRIAAVGVGIQLIAGPFDFYWHSVHGFDPFLFTPAHSLLIVGLVLDGIGMFLGTVRLLQAQREGFKITTSPKTLNFLVVLGLASVWMIGNFASYWVTDTTGMAYSFGLCTIDQFRLFGRSSCDFVNNPWSYVLSNIGSSAIFAASGVLTFLAARALFIRKGAITLAALLSMAVYSFTVLGFMAYILIYAGPPGTFYLTSPSPAIGIQMAMFLPFYLLSVVPIALVDLLPRLYLSKTSLYAISLILGPFAALVDARYASMFPGSSLEGKIIVVSAEMVGGIIAATVFLKLKTVVATVPVHPIRVEVVAAKRAAVH